MKIKYKINKTIIDDYVNYMNSINKPIYKIKEDMCNYKKDKTIDNRVEVINNLIDLIDKYTNDYYKDYSNIMFDVIKQIMYSNNGFLTTRMIEPINISRQYLSLMEKNKEIEKVSRGIYVSPMTFEDSYYSFQSKYKKVIYSHMNALYFYGLTEEFPSPYTVTVPNSYHTNDVNNKCNVFYVDDSLYELGAIYINTPSGNKVRSYDLERSICDIIRSKNRMDYEQVEKSIKLYFKIENKNIDKLIEYSKKLNVYKQVMEYIGEYVK